MVNMILNVFSMTNNIVRKSIFAYRNFSLLVVIIIVMIGDRVECKNGDSCIFIALKSCEFLQTKKLDNKAGYTKRRCW